MDWRTGRYASGEDVHRWQHTGSNLLLDFHGDPARAELVIFSDGNHHMALREVLGRFGRETSGLNEIFYATTPPAPIVTLLEHGKLLLGNFVLSVAPHLFIGPPRVLDRLTETGHMACHRPFVRNQGNVLLVKRGNPKKIAGVNDLERPGVTVFLSNPDTETASHRSYRDTLTNLSGDPAFESGLRIIYGQRIHHREAPVAVATGRADAAVVFYHLALHFTRRFPGEFEMVPLGGTVEEPDPCEGNCIATTHVGLIGDGGPYGRTCLDYLGCEAVQTIYRHHGLIPL